MTLTRINGIKRLKRRKKVRPNVGVVLCPAGVTFSYAINVNPIIEENYGGFRLSVLIQVNGQKTKHIVFQADSDRKNPSVLFDVLDAFLNGNIAAQYLDLKKSLYVAKKNSMV